MVKLPKCIMRHIMENYVDIQSISKLYLISKVFHVLNNNDIGIIKMLVCGCCSCGHNYLDLCICMVYNNICEQCGVIKCGDCIGGLTYNYINYCTKKECTKCLKQLCKKCTCYCMSYAETYASLMNVYCGNCYNGLYCEICNK